MGMVVYLYRASADEVASLAAAPDTVHQTIFAEDAGERIVDFDKAWHALHFMLTGESGKTDAPLSILVATDEDLIGTDEFGLGGYWLIEPAGVHAFADALSAISDEALAARYDPSAMAMEHVYLADLFEEDGEEALSYVMQGVPALRKFARDAADAGNHIVGVLS